MVPEEMHELYRTELWSFYLSNKNEVKTVLAVSNDELKKNCWFLNMGKTILAKNQNEEEIEYSGDQGIVLFKEKFGIVPQIILKEIAFREEHTIYMMLDYNNLFWKDGIVSSIGGNDGIISMRGFWEYEYDQQYKEDYLNCYVQNLGNWFRRFPFFECWNVFNPECKKVIENFDFLKWEKMGIEFARIIKRKLPQKWKLIYMTPSEDHYSHFSEETLISNKFLSRFIMPCDPNSMCLGLKMPIQFYTCAAWCYVHGAFLTVENIGDHQCLQKHCTALKGLWHHPFWKRHRFLRDERTKK